jgi:hypothetical protein
VTIASTGPENPDVGIHSTVTHWLGAAEPDGLTTTFPFAVTVPFQLKEFPAPFRMDAKTLSQETPESFSQAHETGADKVKTTIPIIAAKKYFFIKKLLFRSSNRLNYILGFYLCQQSIYNLTSLFLSFFTVKIVGGYGKS